MNKDQKLLEEAYQMIYEKEELHSEVREYIANGSKGDLNLDQVKTLRSLPDNLEVEGNLILRHTKIKALPNNLKIGGELDLLGSSIVSLPDDLKINGELNLLGSPIRFLPRGLEVCGDLNIGWTNIDSLPGDLKVGGNLILTGSKVVHVSQLPLTMKIRGKIRSRTIDERDLANHKKAVRRAVKVTKELSKDFSQEDLEALKDF